MPISGALSPEFLIQKLWGVSSRLLISIKFPDDVPTAGPGTVIENYNVNECEGAHLKRE
jgi:hypothetical protein